MQEKNIQYFRGKSLQLPQRVKDDRIPKRSSVFSREEDVNKDKDETDTTSNYLQWCQALLNAE
jgi:hypothetical protein